MSNYWFWPTPKEILDCERGPRLRDTPPTSEQMLCTRSLVYLISELSQMVPTFASSLKKKSRISILGLTPLYIHHKPYQGKKRNSLKQGCSRKPLHLVYSFTQKRKCYLFTQENIILIIQMRCCRNLRQEEELCPVSLVINSDVLQYLQCGGS